MDIKNIYPLLITMVDHYNDPYFIYDEVNVYAAMNYLELKYILTKN